jgi:hypothetical protein
MQGLRMEYCAAELRKQIRNACYAGLETHNISD